MNHIRFLDSKVELPLLFNAMLPFSENDKKYMSWINQKSRHYGIYNELKKGGRAIAYKGYFSDENGNQIQDTRSVVIKLPNIQPDMYTFDQVREYLSRQSEEGGREWQLTHKRLYDCKYANPIFDYNVYQVTYLGDVVPFPVTVQLFLDDTYTYSLDDYLLHTKQRTEPYKSSRGIPYDNWKGMSDPARWLELARCIATGLADIHQRRVVHGDIWPPNIFIKVDEQGKIYPIFIDFGEAFPLEPRGVPREQRDHAYRAPERRDAQSIVTQLADVYSFGKLLLHLAIGEEPILPSSFRGHQRREKIREKFASRNPGIVSDNPFIVDIVCKCLSLDPVDRPTMNEVLRALNSYVDLSSFTSPKQNIDKRLISLDQTWQKTVERLAERDSIVGAFLEELVEQRIQDIEVLIEGLSNDVVNLKDTRERLILDLLVLFRGLGEGDRFISLTNPRMWQGAALGLDGRYMTATQLATVRGASIQRTFLISVQELGERWSTVLSNKLEEYGKTNNCPQALELAVSLRIETNKYLGYLKQGEARELPLDLQLEARERLQLIIKSYAETSAGLCNGLFDRSEKFTSSADCNGIYLGIIPVSTLSQMRIYKATNPASVLFYSKADEDDQYLLMMTDCLGRNSFGGSDENPLDDVSFQQSKPELKGLTVFKSVLGIPEDRIKKLERMFKQSASVGGWIESFYKIIVEVQALSQNED